MRPDPGPHPTPRARGHVLAAGTASGPALVLEAPLSFWGGVDPRTGLITDRHHPQHGQRVTGRVLLLPAGRGSSSSSSVLAEAIRLGTAPLALLLREADEILVLGALVAEHLYGRSCPLLVLPEAAYRAVMTGDRVAVRADGTVTVTAAAARSSSASASL